MTIRPKAIKNNYLYVWNYFNFEKTIENWQTIMCTIWENSNPDYQSTRRAIWSPYLDGRPSQIFICWTILNVSRKQNSFFLSFRTEKLKLLTIIVSILFEDLKFEFAFKKTKKLWESIFDGQLTPFLRLINSAIDAIFLKVDCQLLRHSCQSIQI